MVSYFSILSLVMAASVLLAANPTNAFVSRGHTDCKTGKGHCIILTNALADVADDRNATCRGACQFSEDSQAIATCYTGGGRVDVDFGSKTSYFKKTGDVKSVYWASQRHLKAHKRTTKTTKKYDNLIVKCN